MKRPLILLALTLSLSVNAVENINVKQKGPIVTFHFEDYSLAKSYMLEFSDGHKWYYAGYTSYWKKAKGNYFIEVDMDAFHIPSRSKYGRIKTIYKDGSVKYSNLLIFKEPTIK